MNNIDGFIRLKNQFRHYDWGSYDFIPDFLGFENSQNLPWAEMWMGSHPGAPSMVEKDGTLISLGNLIAENTEYCLGKRGAEKYGQLPFLFKLLAAGKPLSIQAHPPEGKASEGFHRENREGLPLDAPNRNYRDTRHKPEIICALNSFAALCGFRKKEEIYSLIEIISKISDGELKQSMEKLMSALKQEAENPLRTFIKTFITEFSGSHELGQLLIKRQALLERDFPEYKGEWKICSYLASLYPADGSVIAPLFLNILELKPGEAMYIPTGILHAYIYGFGIELMADSDNVIRGGLTAKHIDREELLKILDFSEYQPEIIKAPDSSPGPFHSSYPARYEEFTLSVMKSQGDRVFYSETGPSIVMVSEGNAAVASGNDTLLEMKTGESIFIPAGKDLFFSGTFNAFAAAANVTIAVNTADACRSL